MFQNPQLVGSIPICILYSIFCSLDGQICLWSQITSLIWSFGRVIFFAITSTRMHQLCSFFNMMRILSSVMSGIKGAYFCSAVLEKLASKLALGFSTRSGWHQTTPLFKLWILLILVTKLVFWIARLTYIPDMYVLYSSFAGLDVQFWLCSRSTLLFWSFGTVLLLCNNSL